MKDLKKPKENAWGDDWLDYSYNDLLDSFEIECVLMECCGDYQGDYVCLFKDEGKYGFLVFGYGSCSGCDALEATNMNGYDQVVVLRDSLFDKIRWGTAEEIISFLEKEEKRDWWACDDDVREAMAKIIEYIKNELYF